VARGQTLAGSEILNQSLIQYRQAFIILLDCLLRPKKYQKVSYTQVCTGMPVNEKIAIIKGLFVFVTLCSSVPYTCHLNCDDRGICPQ